MQASCFLRRTFVVFILSGAALTLQAAAEWRALFNGRDLAGWERWLGCPPATKDVPGLKRDANGKYLDPVGLERDTWQVFTVVTLPDGPAIRISGEIFGGLVTKEYFSNYRLRLQVKWGEKRFPPRDQVVRDSGLLYHSYGEHGGADGRAWMTSHELQIQEGDFGDYWGVGIVAMETNASGRERDKFKYDPSSPATAFGRATSNGRHVLKSHDAEKPHGAWNTVEVICVGDEAIHVVNGEVVMRLHRLQQADAGGQMVPATEGKLQLQSEGAEVFYRAIEIQPITEIPAEYRKQ